MKELLVGMFTTAIAFGIIHLLFISELFQIVLVVLLFLAVSYLVGCLILSLPHKQN